MIAYFNGRFLDQSELKISPLDSGFVLGVTIAEQLRTFAGQPFQVEAHLERMAKGVDAIGLTDQVSLSELPAIIDELVSKNCGEIESESDLGVTVFATPGIYRTYAPDVPPQPTIAVHTYQLPFQLWAHKYDDGQRLVIVDVRQISPESWPSDIKCRSRMHYYLADRQARVLDPTANGLLLDGDGCISETSIANVVLHLPDEGFVSPRKSQILPGVSLEFLTTLASNRGIPFHFRDVTVDELAKADEILLTSTPFCLVPVSSIQGGQYRSDGPGQMFETLCRDWIEHVNCDFVSQARKMTIN